MHMAEVQESTEVSNEEGTGGNMGRGWHNVPVCVCVGRGDQECREGLMGVD